jgi:hypothetical protein
VRAKSDLAAHKVSQTFSNVWLLETDTGRCKVEDFLDAIEQSNFNKLLPVMRRVDANPSYRHPERFKQLSGPVFEFKSHKHRLFCFQADRGFICTDGMKKQKGRRTRQSDRMIESAAQLAERFSKEGTYVE